MAAFKIDENLPRDAAAILQRHGHDAVTVYEERLMGSSDSNLASICKSEGRALVTLDLGFSNIRAYPPTEHPGIIVLRCTYQDKATVLSFVERILQTLAEEPLVGRLWIVESDRVRIWRSWHGTAD